MFSGDDGADKGQKGDDSGDSRADKDRAKRRKGISSPSILSADLKIHGDVETAGDLHIDGVILGDVRSRRVTVGKDGEVRGTVSGDEVSIRGKVIGEVEAQAVALSKTARVEATIFHETLTVEPGAELLGRTTRKTRDAAEKAAAVTEASKDAAPAPTATPEPKAEAATAAPPPSSVADSAVPADKPTAAEPAASGPANGSTVKSLQGNGSEGGNATQVESAETAEKPRQVEQPAFEPLPSVIAAGPAELDNRMAGQSGQAQDGGESKTAKASGSGGLRFRPFGGSEATH